MCRVLVYGEDTEIHIAGVIDMKKLAWLSVEDYGTTVMEIIVASAMKGYLRRMSEKEALKKVESIIDPKVIQLFGEGGAPMPVQSHVDGAKFAAFIDEAVADSIRELEVKLGVGAFACAAFGGEQVGFAVHADAGAMKQQGVPF